MENSVAFKMLDDWIFNKYNIHLTNEEGSLDVGSIIKVLPNGVRSRLSNIESVKDLVIDTDSKVDSKDNMDIYFDENELVMCVPKEIREKVMFSVEYILGSFDKLENAIADISKEFQVDREGSIINAQKEMANFESSFNGDSKQIIIGCINSVGNAIEQIKKSILSVVDEVNDMPKNRMKRLFKPIEKTLKEVLLGRVSVGDYIYGTAVYAELNMKIGRKEAAISRMQDAIDFLENLIESGRLERVEQWNKMKDMFWKDGVREYIEVMQEKLNSIENYDGKIRLLEEYYE